ncbi:hypothetical protein HYE67_008340 [Fusarium culmorum]|uniref:Uncharacterized protein n=1 Tax=Fusarium culmorum TaxID=5516 RepID=A0A2T4H8M6_FUSCU|nr:hypothetical protein FCULG_00003031 [Fusarium culmorum]QPC66109.1 hypothetical protein HYE67_008340 [Fusarium culmorum]
MPHVRAGYSPAFAAFASLLIGQHGTRYRGHNRGNLDAYVTNESDSSCNSCNTSRASVLRSQELIEVEIRRVKVIRSYGRYEPDLADQSEKAVRSVKRSLQATICVVCMYSDTDFLSGPCQGGIRSERYPGVSPWVLVASEPGLLQGEVCMNRIIASNFGLTKHLGDITEPSSGLCLAQQSAANDINAWASGHLLRSSTSAVTVYGLSTESSVEQILASCTGKLCEMKLMDEGEVRLAQPAYLAANMVQYSKVLDSKR